MSRPTAPLLICTLLPVLAVAAPATARRWDQQALEHLEVTMGYSDVVLIPTDDKKVFEFTARDGRLSCRGSIGLSVNKGAVTTFLDSRCEGPEEQALPHGASERAVAYARACDEGSADVCADLALLYARGGDVPEDQAHATRLFQVACDDGSMSGCAGLGLQLAAGAGVERDYGRAAEVQEGACDAGHLPACSHLGLLLYHGAGVARDHVRARELQRRACDGEVMQACAALGAMMVQGQGGDEDIEGGKALLQRACDGGEGVACDNLRALE